MKKLLLSIGFLLLPQTVMADALSPWVQEVLLRADAGIATADAILVSPPTRPCDQVANVQEIKNNLSILRQERRIAVDLGLESQFLRERTLCLESDRLQLQYKLDVIENGMNKATLACSIRASEVFRDVYGFTLSAYRIFLRGSVDSSFSDTLLRYHYPFESENDLNTMARPVIDDTHEDASMCVFTTDYSPHFIGYLPPQPDAVADADDEDMEDEEPDIKTYGCDASILSQIRAGLPPALQTEADDLKDFLNQSDSLASEIFTIVSQALQNIEEAIAAITGAPAPDPLETPASAPPHATEVGCLLPPSPEPQDGSSADPAAFHSVLSAFPDYFRPSRIRELENGDKTYTPPLGKVLPIVSLFRLSYDFFTTMPSALILSRAFDHRKAEIGNDRPLPPDLVVGENAVYSTFIDVRDRSNALRMLAEDEERHRGTTESIFRDSYERTLDAVNPLESAVKSLSEITEGFLPNEYIPSVAYFLRRSCVDGHCSDLLDSVTQRSFNPYCHPYVSGKYKDEQAADKCFCRNEFVDSDFCWGRPSPPGNPAEIRCGELPPPPSSSSSVPSF